MATHRSLPLASLLGALALALLAAPASAKVVERDLSGDTSLSKKQMMRAEPRELMRAPASTATPQSYSAPATSAGKKERIHVPGREPREPHPSTELGPLFTPPFDSGEVPAPTAYPNSTWGKVFAKIRGVGAYTCSASVVRARNRSVLFTAGHCVQEPLFRRWAHKFTFVPAYTNGEAPFGAWQAKRLFSTKQWVKRGNMNFDYAAVKLKRRNGQRIEDVTGSLGLLVNGARRQTYRAAGYPQNKASGQRMWECISDYKGTDPNYLRPGPKPFGIGCDMTQGTSGGGWSTLGGDLVSVSSFGYASRPDLLFGPAFSARTMKVRRKAQR